MCVTESLLILKRNGYGSATIDFTVGETLGCRLCGLELSEAEQDDVEDEISRALLSALVEKVEFENNEKGGVSGIRFEN